ncbi:hypothetical protein Btru_003917, partial [Bulinus truncatus]
MLRKLHWIHLVYLAPVWSIVVYFILNTKFGLRSHHLQGLTVTVRKNLEINFKENDGNVYFSGYSDFGKAEELLLNYCDNLGDNKNAICLEDPFNQLLSVSESESTREEITCYSFKHQALRCASQIVQDCFDLGKSYWYGGYEAFNQIWPLKSSKSHIDGEDVELQLSMAPYVTGDFGIHKSQVGNVLERLFISSTGIGIFISRDSPLYLSFNANNDNLLCIAAKYDEVHYFNPLSKPPVLEYTVCKSSNVKNIYEYMKRQFIHKPEGRPNVELFHKPIWSTWAQYNRNINQSSVLAFADKIVKYKFPCSQLEIDDRWSFQYGDFDFDSKKFPDPKKMMSELTSKGFAVTLWMHPFFSLLSESFKEAFDRKYIILSKDGKTPALVHWWNDAMSALLDVTNPEAVDWYLNKLSFLKSLYNISSYK